MGASFQSKRRADGIPRDFCDPSHCAAQIELLNLRELRRSRVARRYARTRGGLWALSRADGSIASRLKIFSDATVLILPMNAAFASSVGLLLSLTLVACGSDTPEGDDASDAGASGMTGGTGALGGTAGTSAGTGGHLSTGGSSSGGTGGSGSVGGGGGSGGGSGTVAQGGDGGSGGNVAQGSFGIYPQSSSYIRMRQLEQYLTILDVTRSGGLTAPIKLSLVGLPSQVQVEIGHDGVLEDGLDTVSLNFKTTRIAQKGYWPIKVRGSAEGAPDFEMTLNLDISTERVYKGGFTMGSYTVYGISSTGNRCEWYAGWQAQVEVTIDSLEDNAAGVAIITGTRSSDPLQDQVGTTTCLGGDEEEWGRVEFLSTYPANGFVIPVDLGASTEMIDIGGPYDPLATMIDAKAKITYVRDQGGGESDYALSPLLLQPL